MRRVLLAPLAELVELDFALNELLVLARPIVHALAVLADEFDKLIL